MTATVLAAVCATLDKPPEVMDLRLQAPRAGEVAVRMGACICSSDLAVRNGVLPSPRPLVLGHEGAHVDAAPNSYDTEART